MNIVAHWWITANQESPSLASMSSGSVHNHDGNWVVYINLPWLVIRSNNQLDQFSAGWYRRYGKDSQQPSLNGGIPLSPLEVWSGLVGPMKYRHRTTHRCCVIWPQYVLSRQTNRHLIWRRGEDNQLPGGGRRCWTAELWLARFLCNFIAYIPAISVRFYTLFSYIRTTVDSAISPHSTV